MVLLKKVILSERLKVLLKVTSAVVLQKVLVLRVVKELGLYGAKVVHLVQNLYGN